MLGRLLGAVVGLPLRVANIPLVAVRKIGEALDPDDVTAIREVTDRADAPLGSAASLVEETIEEAMN